MLPLVVPVLCFARRMNSKLTAVVFSFHSIATDNAICIDWTACTYIIFNKRQMFMCGIQFNETASLLERLWRLEGKDNSCLLQYHTEKSWDKERKKKIFVTFLLFLTSLVILFQFIVVAKRLVLSPLPPREKSKSLLLKHSDDFVESASLNYFCF